ncbi:transcription termination factor Rho [Streptomyces sp. TS71-3]|uniref:transcription termination factor Rho n=1 Tax=Streptomyces sp. TS71-3 TaxID=2733862 RepID=UPI001B2CE78A|nr:transcription termination factor Rho [Streptomyces sp. TS71-3]GHJ39221.1 transcription termination factor Rho [Streptomyces sp. TS71-3]
MTTTLEPTTPPSAGQRPEQTAGVLDITRNGQGFLRGPELLPQPRDAQVSAAQIRRLGLRNGDTVVGELGAKRSLGEVALVNGRPPGRRSDRPHFHDLTPLHPLERLRLEHSGSGLTGRVVDLVAPVGKGQRGLIVAPPKAGKTVVLQQLAASLAANHPECHLMVVLLDERPEEVTDMRRRVHGEVLASTFDRSAREHIALAELAVARAQRMVEDGRDVVILLDSLTRLCRAHNNAAAAGGRTLSGGVDASALHGPKRLFGAARLTEEAGSLTILATALVETGSRADDYFFEELKSTGNMELRLDRAQADKRLFPAVDIPASGTRREELLVPSAELTALRGLRRALAAGDGHAGLETLLDRLRSTPDNAAFLRRIHQTVPGA